MKPISKDLISQWELAITTASNLEALIQVRIGYVINLWMKAFGGKLENWYFNDAGEGQVGSLNDHMNGDSIYSIHVDCSPHPKTNDGSSMVIIDKNGDEYGWESEIPVRWLFEDCEEEIVNGKALYDKKLIQKKADAAMKKSLKKKLDTALADQAKAKLTPQELAALKKVL